MTPTFYVISIGFICDPPYGDCPGTWLAPGNAIRVVFCSGEIMAYAWMWDFE